MKITERRIRNQEGWSAVSGDQGLEDREEGGMQVTVTFANPRGATFVLSLLKTNK